MPGPVKVSTLRFLTALPALINTVQCATTWNAKALPSGDQHWVDLSPKWTWDTQENCIGLIVRKASQVQTELNICKLQPIGSPSRNLLWSFPGLAGWSCPKLYRIFIAKATNIETFLWVPKRGLLGALKSPGWRGSSAPEEKSEIRRGWRTERLRFSALPHVVHSSNYRQLLILSKEQSGRNLPLTAHASKEPGLGTPAAQLLSKHKTSPCPGRRLWLKAYAFRPQDCWF